MERTLQKASLSLMVAIFLSIFVAHPSLAQWMGGGMSQGMMRGGEMCRMMDVTPQPIASNIFKPATCFRSHLVAPFYCSFASPNVTNPARE